MPVKLLQVRGHSQRISGKVGKVFFENLGHGWTVKGGSSGWRTSVLQSSGAHIKQ